MKGQFGPGKLESQPNLEAEDIIETFCINYGCSRDHLPDLRGAGSLDGNKEEEFRGGAGGSNATKKKRDIGDCLDKIASLLKDKKVEDAKELEELIQEAKGHLGGQKQGDQGQSFYGLFRNQNREDGKGGGKGKSKTKSKGKIKKEDELPRFDLSRRWPKAQQTTWQSLHKALEEGEIPRGEIAIVKDVQQLRQLQTLAHDLKINKSLLLVAKKVGNDDIPDTCQSLLLPWMGNLAMIDAVVGNLNKQKPNLELEKIQNCKMETAKRDDLVSLRLTAPWKYISEKNKQILLQKPEFSARLLNDSLKEARTNRWENSESLLAGYLLISKHEINKMMNCSGKNGIFVTRLSQDITTKPAALWVTKLEGESHEEYLQRTLQEAKGAPLTWRRGDGNDLGYRCSENDITDKSWALWGIPPLNGPGMVEDWLGQQGWTLKTRPQPPRGKGSPWKIFGQCSEKQSAYAYQVEIDDRIRRLSIVPWKTSRKPKEEIFQVSGPRWFSENFQYERIGPTQVLEPTQIDANMEDGQTEIEDNHKVISPPKKKVKPSKLRGGEPGPEGSNLRTLELGGTGDCGWRSIAYQLAAINSKSSNLADNVISKIAVLGKALRSQALFHLCEVDREWQKFWAPDDAWTPLTEDGPPAKDIKSFATDVLHRDNRWICHYCLMAVAAVKRIHIIVWQYRGDDPTPWTKIAVISPNEDKKRFPIVHLAEDGGHYMPLISDSMQKPDYNLLETGSAWSAKGIQNSIKTETKQIFRAGGEEEMDGRSTHEPSITGNGTMHGLEGGQNGPKGLHLRTLELGGTGDCGWRSIAFQLAVLNSKPGTLNKNVMPMITNLSRILRSQALQFLCEMDRDWQEQWVPDETWTVLTEDGQPAKDLHTFTTDTLHRPNRWICHYGLQAVATIKQVHLVIWQFNDDIEEPWTRIATISPNDEEKHYPYVHLAKDGGHYMPLIPDTIQIPGQELRPNGRTWKSKEIQRNTSIRGGGTSDKFEPDFNAVSGFQETIDDLLKPPDPWTTPSKAAGTPLSPKTAKTFDAMEFLRTPRIPASPMSSLKEIGKDICEHKALRTHQWECPFCQYRCAITGPRKRTQDIRTHLDKFHAVETAKIKKRNIEDGSSATGRHGLGMANLLKPIPFRKISKKDAKIMCPFCGLGTEVQHNNAALRRKTLKNHLKICAKAPKGCTLKIFRAERMKKEGGVCFGDDKQHRNKMIKGIWKKADNRAQELGHVPMRLIESNGQACDVICKRCWRVASHSRTWNKKCEGEQVQERSRILPSVKLWKKFFKKFGKEKLFLDTELNAKQQGKIQRALHESDKRNAILKERRKKHGNKKISKKEHKRLRIEGLRSKAIKEAKSLGHAPVRLDFRRSWQSDGCTNLICRKCWRVSQHTSYWRSNCVGHHTPTRSILPSRAWWKTCIEKIGKAKLYKSLQLNTEEKELIEENIKEYTKRKKEYSKASC